MKNSRDVMAFYHEDGMVPVWLQARAFAGDRGRLATMPDMVSARFGSRPDQAGPWNTYYTTLTAEYFGRGRSGRMLIIVAHGIGPMSTLEGVKKAYSWEYKDKDRSRRGGRITQQEFWDLEDGKYGPVEIIDYEDYCQRYEYPFMEILRYSQAMTDPVLKARLGEAWQHYLVLIAEYARSFHREKAGVEPADRLYQVGDETYLKYVGGCDEQHLRDGAKDSDPYIIKVGDASNCSYYVKTERGLEEGYALGHLVSTGSLCYMGFIPTGGCSREALVHDIDCHEWWNGTRIVGMKSGANILAGIDSCPEATAILRSNWQDFFVPAKEPAEFGFGALMKIGDQWFTQYLKQGERMDTHEPEFLVTEAEKVGGLVTFRTTIGGYHGFFKYGIKEVESLAPVGANAYCVVGAIDTECKDGDPEYHRTEVQFYRVEVDTSQRLRRAKDLSYDHETRMEYADQV